MNTDSSKTPDNSGVASSKGKTANAPITIGRVTLADDHSIECEFETVCGPALLVLKSDRERNDELYSDGVCVVFQSDYEGLRQRLRIADALMLEGAQKIDELRDERDRLKQQVKDLDHAEAVMTATPPRRMK